MRCKSSRVSRDALLAGSRNIQRTAYGLVLAIGFLVAFSAPAEAAKLYLAESDGNLVRFEVAPTGAPSLEGSLAHIPVPVGLAFGPGGELFATSGLDGAGAVYRFLTPDSTPAPNGTIVGSVFRAPHWAAFRGNELLVAQRDGSNVVRFAVPSSGDPIYQGAITQGLVASAPRGIAVSRDGEIFVSECCGVNRISRYRWVGGVPTFSGTILGNGLSNPHDLAFSEWGELFVANAGNNSISRFTLANDGAAQANGQIGGGSLGVPLGLSFSPWGELFVGSVSTRVILRWTFDANRNAIPNGFFEAPAPMRDIEFGPSGNFRDDFEVEPLDSGWNLVQIGSADQAIAVATGGQLQLTGDGEVLYQPAQDSFVFLRRQPRSGDFRCEVDIESFPVDAGGLYRKAGLMIRASDATSSPMVQISYIPNWENSGRAVLQFRYRATAGGPGDGALGSNIYDMPAEPPVRLAIERRGNTFHVFFSTNDGVTWRQPAGGSRGKITLPAFGPTANVGPFVVSYDANVTLTAAFDDFEVATLLP